MSRVPFEGPPLTARVRRVALPGWVWFRLTEEERETVNQNPDAFPADTSVERVRAIAASIRADA
jgi:hypothetical protein